MSYKEKMQDIWRQYEEEHGKEPSTIGDCFTWATRKGLWHPKPVDVAKMFQRDMADALRGEVRTDAEGREYRAKHCIRRTVGGVQLSLWADIDKASRNFMLESVQQRRKGIVDDGYQLKMDVDHFNQYRSKDNPIPLILDITDDVAEMEALKKKDDDDRDTGTG